MARRGRKRKNGHRWANGNIKQPNAAQRHKNAQQLIDLEKAVVLAQPHRRGDKSQNCESPLGRLVAKRKLRHEVFDAGLHYGHKVWLWQAIRGVPVEIHASSGKSTGEGPKDATVRRWNVEITRIDRAMKQYPSPALTRCA